MTHTVELAFIAMEMLVCLSESSRNQNDSDLTIATPKWEDKSYIIYNRYNFCSVIYDFSLLFSLHYQIQFYSGSGRLITRELVLSPGIHSVKNFY